MSPDNFPVHMQRDVRLANMELRRAVYTAHVDFAQLNAIWDAKDRCKLFLLAKACPGVPVWLGQMGMLYRVR